MSKTNLKSYTWCISETFDALEDSSTNSPHGKGSTTIIHNAPWAVQIFQKLEKFF